MLLIIAIWVWSITDNYYSILFRTYYQEKSVTPIFCVNIKENSIFQRVGGKSWSFLLSTFIIRNYNIHLACTSPLTILINVWSVQQSRQQFVLKTPTVLRYKTGSNKIQNNFYILQKSLKIIVLIIYFWSKSAGMFLKFELDKMAIWFLFTVALCM